MVSIQLYGRIQKTNPSANVWTDYQLLELSEAEPIRLTKSVIDLQDPTVVASAFSQTFVLPGTPKNSAFFKGLYNVNSLDFDPSLKIDSYINIEGEFYMSGSLRLLTVFSNYQTGNDEFEVQFVGETRTFGGQIEGKFLAQLNFDDYSHLLTYDNIRLSWNANDASAAKLLGGDIIYPLVEYGYTYDTADQPIQSTLAVYSGTTGGSIRGFTNSSFPLQLTQNRPFIRAKVIWDKIFDAAGFTYTSSFIEGGTGSFFSQIYYTSTTDARPEIYGGLAPFTNAFGNPRQVPMLNTVWTPLIWAQDPEDFDLYNAYNPTTGRFTSPAALSYLNFSGRLNVTYRTQSGVPNPGFFVRMFRIRAGVTVQLGFQTFSVPPAVSPAIGTFVANFFFSTGGTLAGDIFYFEILAGSVNFNFLRIDDGRLTGLFPNIINPQMMFPNDQYTQAEFIKGINTKFNLVWQPDPNNPNNFLIEPWSDWVGQGTSYDWTDKLDESIPVKIDPLFYNLERTLTFRDANEGDWLNFSYEQKYKQTFGELIRESTIQLITDEREITTFFAPVPLAPIGNSNDFLIPHLAQDTETRREPIQVAPRLVFYNGIQTAPKTWYLRNDAAIAQAQTTYALVSSFFVDIPTDTFQTFDLCWTNPPQFWDPAFNSGKTGRTPISAFTGFWGNWFEANYNPFSKVMTGNFVLNTKDIKNLKFNDLLFVRNAWWMPVKFTDFALGSQQSVEVELVKYGGIVINPGLTGGSRPQDLYLQTGLCYGYSACQACCCDGSLGSTLYSNGVNLSVSTFVFATLNGVFPAAGWYKQGITSYNVNSTGVIVGSYDCNLCSCASVVPETLVEEVACEGESFCEAFCCQGGTADIWTLSGFTGATEMYSSASGDPLTPNYWYHVTGTEYVYQVGADGITVIQGVTGGSCACNELPYVSFLPLGIGASGQFASCCISGVTGASGPQTVWMDAPYFLDASDFYEDASGEDPYGNPVEVWFSDGENWVGVSGGTNVSGGSCDDNEFCPDRTNPVVTRLLNYDGVISATLTSQNFISYDYSNFYWANQDVATGVTFDYSYPTNYSNNSWFQNKIVTGAGLTGNISYSIYENSIQVFNDTFGVTGSNSYTLQEFLTGTGSWEVEIEINPS